MASPRLDDVASLGERVEHLAIEEFIAQFPDDALGVTVLPGTAGRDEQRRDAEACEPTADLPGDELGPVVGADGLGHAVLNEKFGQHLEPIVAGKPPPEADREAASRGFVGDGEQAQRPAVVRPRQDEVVGPDMIRPLRPQPNAAAIIAPQATSPGLSCRDLQPPAVARSVRPA